jgi:hypothetical protein
VYCGRECQREHWSAHREFCNAQVQYAADHGQEAAAATAKLHLDYPRRARELKTRLASSAVVVQLLSPVMHHAAKMVAETDCRVAVFVFNSTSGLLRALESGSTEPELKQVAWMSTEDFNQRVRGSAFSEVDPDAAYVTLAVATWVPVPAPDGVLNFWSKTVISIDDPKIARAA